MSRHPDAGMRAVARVRTVRERDSRIGLQQAMTEQRGLESRLTALVHALAEAPGFDAGSVADYVRVRAGQQALTTSIGQVRSELDSASSITSVALAHWHRDKSRLSAVELLLERRADERRVTARRHETRELDDLISQRWQRDGGQAT